jgi:hypothetical protein
MIFRRGRRESMYQKKGKRSHASSGTTPSPVLLTKPVLRFFTHFYARRTRFENSLIGRTHPPPNLCLGGPPNLVRFESEKKPFCKEYAKNKK